MNAEEIREMSEVELAEELDELRKEMFNLRFQKTTGQLADPNRVRLVKRDIARLLTVRREREIWAEYEAARAAAEEA